VAPEAAVVRGSAPVALEEAVGAVALDQDLAGDLEEDLEAAGASRPTTKSLPFCER
jgi:hypothetical protein